MEVEDNLWKLARLARTRADLLAGNAGSSGIGLRNAGVEDLATRARSRVEVEEGARMEIREKHKKSLAASVSLVENWDISVRTVTKTKENPAL